MHRFAVAALLVACLGVAVATPATAPRPKTGAPSCVAPINSITCNLQAGTGFVFGFNYRTEVETFAPASASYLVCSAASSSSRVVAQKINLNQAGAGVDPLTKLPSVGIYKMDIMSLPGVAVKGTIPAIKMYLWNYVQGAAPLGPMGFVVCGNQDRLAEMNVVETIESPINGTDSSPYLLSGFQGKCALRNLFTDPTTPVYWVKGISKPCFAQPLGPKAALPTP